jgi:Protein of unknown function (DUF3455)
LCSSVGALAEVFDISCFYNQGGFSNIQECVDAIWWGGPNMTQSELVTRLQNEFSLNLLGQHYFIQGSSSNALSPVWDFRSTTGNSNAIMIANKTGDLPAPTGPGDVDWLELKNVSGGLAGELFRVVTYKGQPPASVCLSVRCVVFDQCDFLFIVHSWITADLSQVFFAIL